MRRPVLTATDPHVLKARLRSAHARERVADTLLGVALDVIEPFASDYLSPDVYNDLCGTVQLPVDRATEAAVTTMVSELARVLEADADVARRFPRSHQWRP
jgi:hypothetical protein